MMQIDDDRLMAYADGELDAAERQAVKQALAEDPGLRETLAEQQRLRATPSGHYGPVAAEAVPDRLLAVLGARNTRDAGASLPPDPAKRHPPPCRHPGTLAARPAARGDA